MKALRHRQAFKGTMALVRAAINEAKTQYAEALSRRVDLSKADMWEHLKWFRIGTSGRRIKAHMLLASEYTTKIHRPYYTATQASDAAVSHFAEVEGGYIAPQ